MVAISSTPLGPPMISSPYANVTLKCSILQLDNNDDDRTVFNICYVKSGMFPKVTKQI